jgi:hypothetical protein
MIIYLIFLETILPSDKNKWPELVGTKGEDAVEIIKQETGRCVIMHRKISFKKLN